MIMIRFFSTKHKFWVRKRNVCFNRIKKRLHETFLYPIKNKCYYRHLFKLIINMFYSLNQVCPKFISNKGVFLKIKVASFRGFNVYRYNI